MDRVVRVLQDTADLYVSMCGFCNPLRTSATTINLIYIQKLSSYRAGNTVHLGYKTNQLIMLYTKRTAGCSDSHTKHTNAKRRQKVDFFFPAKPGGA